MAVTQNSGWALVGSNSIVITPSYYELEMGWKQAFDNAQSGQFILACGVNEEGNHPNHKTLIK